MSAVWTITYRDEKGVLVTHNYPTKTVAVWAYLSEARFAGGIGHSEVTIWRGIENYTATLNKFLNKN